jgi:hypothetical protein
LAVTTVDWLKWPAACAAFAGFGAWAAWINQHHEHVWRFALLQGSYAFASTLLLRQITLFLQSRFSRASHPNTLTAFAAIVLAFLMPLSLQALAGNPASLRSIAPGFVASVNFIVLLLLKHARVGRSEAH